MMQCAADPSCVLAESYNLVCILLDKLLQALLCPVAWHLSTKVSARRHVTFARCSQAEIQNRNATQLFCFKKIGKIFRLGGVTSAAAIVDSCSLLDMQCLRGAAWVTCKICWVQPTLNQRYKLWRLWRLPRRRCHPLMNAHLQIFLNPS